MLSAKADPRQDALSMLHALLTLANKTNSVKVYKALWSGIKGLGKVDTSIGIILIYLVEEIFHQESKLQCLSVHLFVRPSVARLKSHLVLELC